MSFKSATGLIILIGFTGFLAVVLLTFSAYYSIIQDKNKLLNYKREGVVLTDRNNTPFFYLGERDQIEFVELEEISDTVKEAVIASEDDSFYSHPGFSIEGILRAAYLNTKGGGVSHGGSTLTQQLVKNTLLTPERSYTRKFQELVLSLLVERRYSKEEILEVYLNTSYFGEGMVGIQKASQGYFGKRASELSLSESAFLASLLTSPSSLSPYAGNDERKAEAERLKILEEMRRDGFITDAELEKARGTVPIFKQEAEHVNTVAQHFALMVKDEMIDKYGEDALEDGYTVRTTIDLPMQQAVEQDLKARKQALEEVGGQNSAVVAIDPRTGEVRALAGSVDWFDESFGKVNMATSPRQPGSSFKPIVYSMALDNNLITPSTVLKDIPTTFEGDYRPRNYSGGFSGNVTVRSALANSLNVPAVSVMEKVGVRSVLNKSEDFGLSGLDGTVSDYGLSLVLGAGEISLLDMVSAYTVFANEGVRHEVSTILSIEDRYGDEVFVSSSDESRVIDPETAFLISSILSDNSARRQTFGNLLSLPFPAAVKTGTTENYRDAWTIGYTPDIVIGVWSGNNDNRPMRSAPGSLMSGPLWKNLMTKFAKDHSGFEKPVGVVLASVCYSEASRSARMEYFKSGTVPRKSCPPPTYVSSSNVDRTDGEITEENEVPTPVSEPSETPTPVPEQIQEEPPVTDTPEESQ